jgi:hypothetical protein
MNPTENQNNSTQQASSINAPSTPQSTNTTPITNPQSQTGQTNKNSKVIRKLIKLVIAAVICVWIFAGLRLPAAFAHIDTHAPTLWVTIIPAVIASSIFVWLAYRINKNG